MLDLERMIISTSAIHQLSKSTEEHNAKIFITAYGFRFLKYYFKFQQNNNKIYLITFDRIPLG